MHSGVPSTPAERIRDVINRHIISGGVAAGQLWQEMPSDEKLEELHRRIQALEALHGVDTSGCLM